MIAIKPPQQFTDAKIVTAHFAKTPKIFLAGSIEMGAAEDWQKIFEAAFEGVDCYLLNPRRDDWDPTWGQSLEHDQFRDQVEWELEGQEVADIIVMHFCPGTKSPITLLELGLFGRKDAKKLIVSCPDGFWRKGNVDVVCNRYGIQRAFNLDDLIRKAAYRVTFKDKAR